MLNVSILFVRRIFCLYFCCHITYLDVLSSVLWCPLWFPHKNDVRFVFTPSCLYDSSCLLCTLCCQFLL